MEIEVLKISSIEDEKKKREEIYLIDDGIKKRKKKIENRSENEFVEEEARGCD